MTARIVHSLLDVLVSLIAAATYSCSSSPGRPGGPPEVGFDFDVERERENLVERVLDGGGSSKSRVLIVVTAADWDLAGIRDSDAGQTIRGHYALHVIHVSSDYLEQEDRQYWSERHASGKYDVSFDQYLQMRNGALSYNDLRTLRKLGVTRTPTAMIFDRRGNLLDYVEGDLDARRGPPPKYRRMNRYVGRPAVQSTPSPRPAHGRNPLVRQENPVLDRVIAPRALSSCYSSRDATRLHSRV